MQENKNLILAVVLCLAVLFGWSYLSEFMGWTPPRQQTAQKSAPQTQSAPAPVAEAAPIKTYAPVAGRAFTVDTPFYAAKFHTGGGVLNSFLLKAYKSTIEPNSPPVNLVSAEAAQFSPLGLLINGQPSWHSGQWNTATDSESLLLDEGQKGSLQLNAVVDGLDLSRNFEFDADTYLIRETITLTNNADHSRAVRLGFTQAMDSSMLSGTRFDQMRVAWDENGALNDEADSDDLDNGIQATGQIYWAGPMSTYFIAASLPAQSAGNVMKAVVRNSIFRVALEMESFTLGAGESREISTSYWLGPKDRKQMEAVSDQLAKSIDFGYLSFIGKFLIWVMEIFYSYCHNWGVALILLTVALRVICWPLNAMQAKSMEKMRQIQPLAKQLQAKYKDDKATMQKEMMALYKTYNIKPAGGCLPMLVQLPIFFGLYQGLLNSLALRHAYFIPYLPGTHILWLADLSTKDPLYITPILMGLTMFLQQRMSPPMGDPMQQKVMMLLPVIFTVLFLTFPSGLVIYWLTNSILQIFQQWLYMRKSKKHPAPPLDAPKPDKKDKAARG